MSSAWAVLRVALGVALGYGLLVLLAQRALMYPGQLTESPRSTGDPPDGVDQIWLDTDDGRVESWLVRPVAGAPRAVLIFAHGNGELIDHWLAEMRAIADRGLAVLLVEYPGYGHSEGRPTRSSIAQTFEAAFDSLSSAVAEGTPVVGWGRSLGGGAITDLARSKHLDALVLQSTFTSAAAMARRSGAPGFLIRDRFDSESALSGYAGPVLVLHGRRDEVIPFAHGVRLSEAREGIRFEEIPYGHNEVGFVWPEIVGLVDGFLAQQGW